jgi:hypothetical protein
LYQGTTLVGPQTIEKTSGFSPCHSTSQTKCSSAGNSRHFMGVFRNDDDPKS